MLPEYMRQHWVGISLATDLLLYRARWKWYKDVNP
jgi:hypothetical protein